MMSRGIKTGPTPWVRSWNQRNRDVESIFGENDSGERSRAIMALLFLFRMFSSFLHQVVLNSGFCNKSEPLTVKTHWLTLACSAEGELL